MNFKLEVRLVYGPCPEAVGDAGFEDATSPWSPRRVKLWREAFFVLLGKWTNEMSFREKLM